MKRALVATLLACLAAAAPAPAQEPPAKKSDGVTYHGTLPEPGVISARFRAGLMYVSSEAGLSIYDVRTPEKPTQIGELRLPNFENEDIDLGRDVALISNDPSEGAGLLHVIDISDPTSPSRITSFPTGTADNGILTGPLAGPQIGYGTGHTASCVDGCNYVYLAGTLQGIDIVDLRDPENPKYVKNFPAEEATGGLASHDVQFDADGNALISGAGGVAAYDVKDPENPKLVYRTDESGKSRYGIEPNDGSTLNDFIHHNSMRLSNSDIAGSSGPPGADSDVVAITEEDYTRPACDGAGSFQTWRLGADGVLRNIGRWDVELDPTRQSLCSAHYFDVRGGLVAQGWYEQGTRFLDVSDPADIRQVGFWIPNKTLTWGALYPPTDTTGEIVYALDNARGIDVLRFDRPEPGDPPRETVVAPPGNAPEPGGGGGDGGAPPPATAASARTNVALAVSDGRTRARRGARLSYRVTLRHLAGPAARDLEVLLRFPRGLMKRGRTRVFRRLAELPQGATKTWVVRVRVPKRARRAARLGEILLQARVTLADDANPRDNRAVDRTTVGRRRMGRAASDHLLAQNLALLPTVRAPRRGRARAIPTQRSAYGWVCRIRG